jgi:two-component sensor histidine kinase
MNLTCDTASPRTARDFCRSALAATATPQVSPGDDVGSVVALIASELVTNSLRAGSTAVTLDVDVRSDRVRVSVHDDAPGAPAVQDAGPAADHGRGLKIVAALATSWSVDENAPGKTVWAEVALGSGAAPTAD